LVVLNTTHGDAKHFPVLYVKTVSLNLPSDFRISDALTEDGIAFIRDGEGMVARGEILRLSAEGPGRIAALSQQWRELCSLATVTDPTPYSGRGLIAFGSMAFDDQSDWQSVLIVPQQVLGVKDGRAWLTTIATEDFAAPTELSDDWITEWRKPEPLHLEPGSLTEDDFEDLVSQALQKLEAGDLEKVVLARDVVAAVPTDFDPRPAIGRLTRRYPSCWTYWVNRRFGASPELLVRVDHGRVSARVLAGTAGRGTDPEVDRAIAGALINSVKNTVEHRLAVESLVNSLDPFCEEIVADEAPFSLALPNVWHLASDVQGIISDDSSVLDLADALHPTAAVAGTPRAEAMELIRQLEPTDRGSYAGPIGWVGADGDGEWVIALRGAVLADGKIIAHAGCGIVNGSSPEAELAETRLKFKPIRQVLGLNADQR
jgi:menaquinone-specific isochorismate synthase